MNIEEMKERKRELGYSIKQISKLSGVPMTTIQKIFSGETKSPRYETMQALTKVFEKKNYSYMFGETAVPYGAGDDEKTIEDYYALPEGLHVELIDGKFYNKYGYDDIYDMSGPSTTHQFISDEIITIFKTFIRDNKGKCLPFTSPIDVQLDENDNSIVQPDILILCDRDKLTKEKIIGAPDFIIEIASPNNVAADTVTKMLKYRELGVKEYWIIFPIEEKIMVYEFTKQDLPVEYSFTDEIPVGIWDGKCKVDFNKIKQSLHEIYGE
ncbi:Uma2 family endonuclease [uncultured Eubacterium sp.]|uniref:Uma2 family endonuclease n=1 Tax=uncultured Eubacterium sp. TaxID=165185 RepID=UPI0025913E3F|nr:Uma2 family endonuclease [uncultured Eubacterium sp.]